MPDTLTQRALNRATLDRQLLLRRHPMPALQAVAHLAGLQAQAPLAPYTGLWTRLETFKPENLSSLISERAVLRAHLMRNTIHLVTTQDYVDSGPLFTQLRARGLQASFGKRLPGLDFTEVRAYAAVVLAGHELTRGQLGKLLAQRWPDADENALAHAATHLLPLVHVPPRGIWGKTGQVTVALAEEWLAEEWLSTPLSALPDATDRLVLRYLAAFGPATVNDIQAWSGLTRLREVTERIAGQLRTLSGPGGEELLDLPGAPRPDPDTPAPPRFLPEYDNLLLSYADRRRVIPHGRPVPLPPGNGSAQGTLLIDGQWNATWKITQSVLHAVLHIQPFIPLSPAAADAITAEGAHLLDFAAKSPANHDIRFG
jgi:Winged helix DNA-binding domain